MVVGVANPCGRIPVGWLPGLLQALEAGLDLIGGMHARLHEIAVLREAAARLGRRLVDVRDPTRDIPVASGRKRGGKRLLTAGPDCALGKKNQARVLTRASERRGTDVNFSATGQTGILLS